MSLPLAASGPVWGTSMPTLIGPFCASDGPPASATAARASGVTSTSSLRMVVSSLREGAEDLVIGERPAQGGRDQAQREPVHLLAIHRIHGVRRDDDAKVTVGGLEGGAQDARRGVDAGQDQGVGAEAAQDELQIRRREH